MKIAFIGGGNMASALIGGMVRQGMDIADLLVVEPFEAARARLKLQFGIDCADAAGAALGGVDAIVMAVKPQNMREAAQSIAPHLKQQLIVSIAAGTRITDLARWLGGHTSIVRCMPNTPALVGMGITGMFAAPAVSAAQRAEAERVLRAVGEVVWVKSEALLDPVTAVSGSGPAYVFYFLEAIAEAGAKLGLEPADAKQLALATFAGAARLAADSPDDFATLREKVTSKGGTTAAALDVMTQREVKQAIGAAVEAASARGTELGALLGKD
jgi:pyrroline-5-carboxylate reductase